MEDLKIYILAGGKSSRMGFDKGLVNLEGKPLIEHLLTAVRLLNLPITIISKNTDYQQFKYPLIKDIVPNKGPLGGLLTALSHSNGQPALLLTCDTPFLPLHILNYLIKNAVKDGITVGSLFKKLHPFPGIYPSKLLPIVQEYIQDNRLKMQQFVQDNPHQILNWDQTYNHYPLAFTNINTKSDLDIAKASINQFKAS